MHQGAGCIRMHVDKAGTSKQPSGCQHELHLIHTKLYLLREQQISKLRGASALLTTLWGLAPIQMTHWLRSSMHVHRNSDHPATRDATPFGMVHHVLD